jgi:IS5 family transposase
MTESAPKECYENKRTEVQRKRAARLRSPLSPEWATTKYVLYLGVAAVDVDGVLVAVDAHGHPAAGLGDLITRGEMRR